MPNCTHPSYASSARAGITVVGDADQRLLRLGELEALEAQPIWLLFHPDLHIQVPGRPAVPARLAFTRQPDPVAIIDACRHLDRQRLGLAHATAAMTVITGIANGRAGALARRAGLLDREEALLHAYLAGAAAGRAGGRLGALPGAAAVAGLARHLGRHVDRDRVAADGLLQVEPQLVAEIRAAKHLAAALAATTEDVAEYIAEDIAEALGRESAHAAGTARATAQEVV